MSIISIRDVVKTYGGVVALNGALLEANAGEVHGILGPNGSGKSTINKILAGSVRPDQGQIEISGEERKISSPTDAATLGVGAVYQQLSVIPDLSVQQNLVLGREPGPMGFVSRKKQRVVAESMFDLLAGGLGPGVRLDTRVAELSPGQQQLVEIGKVLLRDPKILVLDEATAALHRDQVSLLFDIIRERRAIGTCVLFVSHRLDEITTICDRATILRTGKTVATVNLADTSPDELVNLMVGSKLATTERRPSSATNEVALRVSDVSGPNLEGVTFAARRGEIVGLGGLQGQGQSELLMTLFGASKPTRGALAVNGEDFGFGSTARSAKFGIALVPGNRSSQGMFSRRPIQENLSVVSLGKRTMLGVISAAREKQAATRAIEQLQIKIGELADPISSLSGGNAQKVIIAKWLMNEPSVVLLDDPTKGVDIGAKAEIYRLVRELASTGTTIVLNSSEDRELVTLCDRVLVMFEGEIVKELVGDEISEESLVSSALQISAEVEAEESASD